MLTTIRYRCFVTDRQDRVVSVGLIDLSNDAEALLWAAQRLEQSIGCLAELWDKSRLVGKWEKPQPAVELESVKLAS